MASSGNSTATLVNHLEYNAFGTITSQTNSAYQPLQTYTGQIQDSATGLLYYDARWYDPGVAQFISEDPIGFAAGDANLRRYVGNSMPNAVDPTGLEENRSAPPSKAESIISGISATSPMLGYVLDRQKRFSDMIGETIAMKSRNWFHHEFEGGKYRIGGQYGEIEGMVEGGVQTALLFDGESLGQQVVSTAVTSGGFLLKREDEAALINEHAIPKSAAQMGVEDGKQFLREEMFGCMLDDETIKADLEAGNSVGQDKFMVGSAIASILLEPIIASRVSSLLNWLKGAPARVIASSRSAQYYDDLVRLWNSSQIDEGLEWVDAPNNGPYRGGSHADMSGPRTRGDGLDSHHMPDRHANPTVHPNDGPAIQMDPLDHHATSSNGRHGADAARYRAETAQMIREGRYRDAMAREIRDVRRAANEVSNHLRKYNEAIREMLEYARKTGQLPSRN